MTSVFVLMIACFLDVCPASFCSFTIFFQSETHLNLNYLQLYFFFLPLNSQKSAFLPCLVQIHHCFFITFGCSPLESKHRKKIRELKYESHFLPCNAFSFTPTHFFLTKVEVSRQGTQFMSSCILL